MLLTITTTYQPATDLGYLLHKNPARLHTFPLSFGQAHVFYPEATPDRCTAALLLDVDPVGLVRNRRGPARAARWTSTSTIVVTSRQSLDDLKLAPFHLLATEGRVHTDRDHVWHMQTLKRVCEADERLLFAMSTSSLTLRIPRASKSVSAGGKN